MKAIDEKALNQVRQLYDDGLVTHQEFIDKTVAVLDGTVLDNRPRIITGGSYRPIENETQASMDHADAWADHAWVRMPRHRLAMRIAQNYASEVL